MSAASRKARTRLVVCLGLTTDTIGFTVFISMAHGGYTPLLLTLCAVGIFLTTWFLVDAGVQRQADEQLRRSRSVRTPPAA